MMIIKIVITIIIMDNNKGYDNNDNSDNKSITTIFTLPTHYNSN